MFDYLKPHELILLIFGIVLFIVAVLILIHFARKGKNILTIIPVFVISIIMLGFSSYKSIQIDNTILTIEEDLQKPNTKATKQSLKENLDKIDDDRIEKIDNTEKLNILKKAAIEVKDSSKLKIIDRKLRRPK